MKKTLIALALALTLPMQSDAQFFKKLGKALEKVGKTVLETSTSDTNTSSSTTNSSNYTTQYAKTSATTSGATVKSYIPNIKIDIIEAYHFGNGVVVKMTLTNTGSKTESFVFAGVDSKTFATDPSDYGDYSSYWKIGNHDWYHWGQEYSENCWDYKLEPGIKVAAFCNLKGVKDEVSKIKLMKVTARLGGTSFLVGEEEKMYTADFQNLPVKVITGNTNQDNISFNLPTAKFNLLSCKKVNKTVTMTFSLTNTSEDDFTVGSIGDVSIYDSDGNQYNLATMTLGTSSWLKNSVKLPAGITVKGSLTINGVPTSAKEFSLFRFSFKSGDTYKVTIRNQAITNAQSTSTSKR